MLIGLIILWFMGWLGFPIPDRVQKVFMVVIVEKLIALYDVLVALLLGSPLPFPGHRCRCRDLVQCLT